MNLRALLLILASMAPLQGCASLRAAVPSLSAAIADASEALSIISRVLDAWVVSAKPEEKTRLQADLLMVNAWGMLRVATAKTNGTRDLSEEEVDGAFREFRVAYVELHSFLRTNRVLESVQTTSGGMIVIPEPTVMHL